MENTYDMRHRGGKCLLLIWSRRVILPLAALLAFPANLYSQLTATLTGTVDDQTGAVVSGAKSRR